MKPIRVYHIIVPEAILSKLVEGQKCTIERKDGTYMVAGEDEKETPVQIVPRLVRSPKWRDKKKARGNA
jgi:hypothetical protein